MTFAALFATACASPRVRDARHVLAATADAVAMAEESQGPQVQPVAQVEPPRKKGG